MTLRSDNADLRLTEKGRAAGAVSDTRWRRFEATRSELRRVTEMLQSFVLSPQVGHHFVGSLWGAHIKSVRNGRATGSTGKTMVI